jgi:alpha-L-fucosidase
VAAVTELWSKFGKLNEIWFDGGISDRIRERIIPLLNTLQPDAVTFGAGIVNNKNSVDWVGTESAMPNYPVWSSGCGAPGAASPGRSPATYPDGFCPKGSDTTLQSPDVWFWVPNTPIKSLATLIKMYHSTVGANSVMELDFAIDRTGNIDPTHAARYKEFGTWIRQCYGTPKAQSGWILSNSIVLSLPSSSSYSIDRVAIQENLARGQRITTFVVEGMVDGVWISLAAGTSGVGHKRIVSIAHEVAETVNENTIAQRTVTKLRLNVTDGVGLPANISLSAFASCPSS